LRQEAGRADLGATLRVQKRIPLGAGLGGGSSDAATTLVALNTLWGLGLSTETLARIGLTLGADVPVFVRGSNAIARGVGEVLEPVELPPRAYAIVFPGVPVATREAFQTPELTRNSPPITIPGFPLPGVSGAMLPGRNDLEPVVAARVPAVRAALDWLGARAPARMTGSGACVFAPFGDRRAAEAALADLPAAWTGFAVVGLGRSPLQARVAAEETGERHADRR
jgi:4-diphosphocytidyl-2-C-methyl-D-erythritol kinase